MMKRKITTAFLAVSISIWGGWGCANKEAVKANAIETPEQAAEVNSQSPVEPTMPEEMKERGALPKLQTVYFDFDKAILRTEARTALNKNVNQLAKHPTSAVTVEGHCDERGSLSYNQKLGERRAKAVRDYYMAQGVDPSRLRTMSFGKSRAVCSTAKESCWQQNRRSRSLMEIMQDTRAH